MSFENVAPQSSWLSWGNARPTDMRMMSGFSMGPSILAAPERMLESQLVGSQAESERALMEKKREYNRCAQRNFRRNRKEYLKSLEGARKEQFAVKSENETLQQRVAELTEEVESLRNSSGSSASTISLSQGNSKIPVQTGGQSKRLSMLPSSRIEDEVSNMIIFNPYNMDDVRGQLRKLFGPLLDLTPRWTSEKHLHTLELLEPILPPQLKPTPLQLATAHSAYIDLIPSPSLRNSLISADGKETSRFIQEIGPMFVGKTEGPKHLIIWGQDWLDETGWEFSEDVIRKWGGWLLTVEWIKRANFFRKQRGERVIFELHEMSDPR